MANLDDILNVIKDRHADADVSVEDSFGDAVMVVAKSQLLDVLTSLKQEGFDLLLDIAGVDNMKREAPERFELVYMLYSVGQDLRLRVKVYVPEDDLNVPSATGLWQAANWGEREAFDMFGFNFEGHPNLERILCHREFVGHALRKDYPTLKGQWATSTSDLRPDLERE
ncbi:MAG: NADH-quinone oxidoreductase subunit C [Candidatus Latescibacterota bacterium]|nr:MAG: NADH-quinone oxidoreductase subunit C [Candidatus Latescibacterota bacterium]